MTFYTSSANAGAILPEQIHQLIDIPVAAQSIAFQVSTVVETGNHSIKFPLLTGDVSAAWTAEGAEISPSDPSVNELDVTPLKIAGLTIISNEMRSDSNPAAQGMIGSSVSRSIAHKVDAAYFGAAGASTVQPKGLGDLTSFSDVDGPATWANLDPFMASIGNVEALGIDPAELSFVVHPTDALALANLKETSTSIRPVLQPDPTRPGRKVIAGVPVYVTADGTTAGTVWGVPKSRSLLVRRAGTTLEVDTSAYFTSDRTAIRATSRVAFGFPQPAAIQKITMDA